MVRRRDGALTSIFALLTYVIMVGTNALANILPINGVTTGEVSDSFPNLFAPAGITFSIWGVIYLLLGIYSIYQIVYTFKGYGERIGLKRINLFYIVSSIANSLWIYFWHNKQLAITVVLMLVILISLITIILTLKSTRSSSERILWASLPFSVYFGWITIATIANITGFLVDMGWGGLGISETVWTIIILITGLAIGGTTIWRLNDKAYGAVMVWSYLGILLKHVSQDGFAGNYPGIIITSGIAIGIFLSIIFLTTRRKRYMFNNY